MYSVCDPLHLKCILPDDHQVTEAILAHDMPEAWRLALRRDDLNRDAADAAIVARRDRAVHAREIKQKNLIKRREEDRIARLPSQSSLQSVAISCPAAAPMLGVRVASSRKLFQADLANVVRLAVSPRFRGSGPAVEKGRALQSAAVALVARAALSRQRMGLSRWLDNGGHSAPPGVDWDQESCRGFTVMWDEASQKSRSLKAKATNAPRDVQVFVALAAIFSMRSAAGVCDDVQWQPWLCPAMFLASTKHEYLLESLRKVLPFDYTDRSSLRRFCTGSVFTIVVLGFCTDPSPHPLSRAETLYLFVLYQSTISHLGL